MAANNAVTNLNQATPKEPLPEEPEAASLFAPGELRDYAGYVWRAIGRRRRLAGSIAVLFALATTVVVGLYPRKYHTQAKLLALPAEGAPGSGHGSYSSGLPGSLSRDAVEGVVARDYLVSLVRELDLLARWQATRPAVLQGVDQLLGRFEGDEAARVDVLVTVLSRSLGIEVKDNMVVLDLYWQDPESALKVVDAIGRQLVEARRAAEINPLAEKVAVLEGRVAETQRRIEATLGQLESSQKKRREGASPATLRGVQAEGNWRSLPDARLAELRLLLLSKRKVIQEMEDVYRKRLAELDTLRAERRATFGPGHPALREAEARFAALDRQMKEVATLRGEEQQLLAEFVERGGKDSDLSAEPPAWSPELMEDSQAMTYGKARLAMEIEQLHMLLSQVADAQVALATARVAFPERYRVVEPAQAPKKPASPNVPLLWLAGILAGLLVAGFSAVVMDLRGGVIREGWQVERLLDVPLLAEVSIR